jgi:hypothetical protein
MKLEFAWAAFICLTWLLTTGCSHHKIVEPLPEQPGSLQIVVPSDSPGFSLCDPDSMSIQGVVVVKDQQGRNMSGVLVQLQLARGRGTVSETANESGHVGFHCRVATSEEDTLIVTCESLALRMPLFNVPFPADYSRLQVIVTPDTLRTQNPDLDSVRVTACVTDTLRRSLACVPLQIAAVGGRLRALPQTDFMGCADTYWSPGSYGTFCVYVELGSVMDSACVVVINGF